MAASYPTAVKSFTVKAAGDTIQPAHVNDLQDEVAAIEGGLLNGTAPLNSSHSTVATLSVTGGSTMGTLQVSSNCTIAGTLTVNKIVSTSITGGGVTSYVRVYADAPAEYGTASTFTRLALNQEVADLLSEWDSTAYLFTPQSSGYYLVTGRAQSITGAAGDVQCALEVNSSLVALGGDMYAAGVAYGWLSVSAVLNLSSGTAGALAFKAYGASTGRCSSGVTATALEIIKLF
jgi:hypothetical protein